MIIWFGSSCRSSSSTFYTIPDFEKHRRDDQFSSGNRHAINGGERDAPNLTKLGSSSTIELHAEAAYGESKATTVTPASVMTGSF
ncbi:probable auxin efflux carrier component 1d [Papaver somniferum]|uniref:probable auxin efflux carrier component 1d n=1 Tax=Papaver somniferum TaxID=3469 RepID=UPI000E701908|nr:probable auxin efflux carrier component 1d [Papaver somniferum]